MYVNRWGLDAEELKRWAVLVIKFLFVSQLQPYHFALFHSAKTDTTKMNFSVISWLPANFC